MSRWREGVGVLILLAALGAAGNSVYIEVRRQQLAECTVTWNDYLYTTLTERSKAAAQVADAQDELVRAEPKTIEEARANRRKYLEAREAMKKAQKEHPYPAPPTEKCK